MDNKVFIKKEGNSVKLILTEKGKVVDMLIMPLDFGFDTVLVTSIDKLLKKNRITKVSPLEFILEGFEDESGMSFLIAKTTIEALKTK